MSRVSIGDVYEQRNIDDQIVRGLINDRYNTGLTSFSFDRRHSKKPNAIALTPAARTLIAERRALQIEEKTRDLVVDIQAWKVETADVIPLNRK